jgi:hypothetical protein
MLPLSIVIATIATASGVGGATFFAPLFVLALGIPPEVAIGTALITEVFGFASGLYAYARKRLIDYRLGTALLVTTIPLALLGTWLSEHIESSLTFSRRFWASGSLPWQPTPCGPRSSRPSAAWMLLFYKNTVVERAKPA